MIQTNTLCVTNVFASVIVSVGVKHSDLESETGVHILPVLLSSSAVLQADECFESSVLLYVE